MLKIEKPTVEEAVACVLISTCVDAALQDATKATNGRLDLVFALMLAQSDPKGPLVGPLTVRCSAKAAELLADLKAIAQHADELLRSAPASEPNT